MNREQRRNYIKSMKIMGKRLSRSQRKYIYNKMKEEDITENENVENVSYDIAKTYQRALVGRISKSKYF